MLQTSTKGTCQHSGEHLQQMNNSESHERNVRLTHKMIEKANIIKKLCCVANNPQRWAIVNTNIANIHKMGGIVNVTHIHITAVINRELSRRWCCKQSTKMGNCQHHAIHTTLRLRRSCRLFLTRWVEKLHNVVCRCIAL